MKPDKFTRIVNNPRHIPSVYNYCDRWCERCPLTLRCSVFAVGQVEDREPREHDPKGEELWERLSQLAPAAAALLSNHADHPGLPLSKSPKFKNHDRPLDRHRLGAAAKRYMEFAHSFVTKNEALIAAAQPVTGVPITPAEAFEIIAYYHFSVVIKLSRAISGREEEEREIAEDPEMAEFLSDARGSAKVVLILIDRSILAWTGLSQHLPALAAATILPAILTLNRLRTGIEKEFPDARSFVRPGFDTLKFTRKRIV